MLRVQRAIPTERGCVRRHHCHLHFAFGSCQKIALALSPLLGSQKVVRSFHKKAAVRPMSFT
jgi:hypothetical protein